jgi:transcription elongation factor GreB
VQLARPARRAAIARGASRGYGAAVSDRSQSIPITPKGARSLQRELDTLWNVERRRVTSEVAAAAAQGDRSENAEYIYGKRRLREIDRRIRFLRGRLDRVAVVEPGAVADRERVFFGAWVALEDDDGAICRYRIVGPDEIDVEAGAISVESPLGRALLGKREGDAVDVHRPQPQEPVQYTVVLIEYETKA